LFSGGIRLSYKSMMPKVGDLREGVLLEAGFDTVTPNAAKDISSWAYDYAAPKIDIIDNRAKASRATTRATPLSKSYRRFRRSSASSRRKRKEIHRLHAALLRCAQLAHAPEVQEFIGTDAYKEHKAKRFRGGDERDLTRIRPFT